MWRRGVVRSSSSFFFHLPSLTKRVLSFLVLPGVGATSTTAHRVTCARWARLHGGTYKNNDPSGTCSATAREPRRLPWCLEEKSRHCRPASPLCSAPLSQPNKAGPKPRPALARGEGSKRRCLVCVAARKHKEARARRGPWRSRVASRDHHSTGPAPHTSEFFEVIISPMMRPYRPSACAEV